VNVIRRKRVKTEFKPKRIQFVCYYAGSTCGNMLAGGTQLKFDEPAILIFSVVLF
jgi:hypothetical protein